MVWIHVFVIYVNMYLNNLEFNLPLELMKNVLVEKYLIDSYEILRLLQYSFRST